MFEPVPQVAEEIVHRISERAVEQVGRAKVPVFFLAFRTLRRGRLRWPTPGDLELVQRQLSQNSERIHHSFVVAQDHDVEQFTVLLRTPQ